MMARDLARAFDPVLMALDCGLEPDPWQADLLRTAPPRSLLLCSRQSGKSTVTALLALHVAIYSPPALILLVSPSQRQSGELFRTVMRYHAALDGAPALTAESTLRAELQTASAFSRCRVLSEPYAAIAARTSWLSTKRRASRRI